MVAKPAHPPGLEAEMNTTTYPIGTTYTDRQGRKCTVADVWTTTNAKGEVVNVRYVTVHPFCGQLVSDTDVVAASIARGNPETPKTVEG